MDTYQIAFHKMTGAGNDFVVFDNRSTRFSDGELSEIAARLCVRRTSIGADGLLALNSPSDGVHDYRMRYFNADGSRATMCGNGARCLARYALDVGFDAGDLTVESDAGTHLVRIPSERGESVRLYMEIPEDPPEKTVLEELPESSLAPVYKIWTGTEHVVCFVDDLDQVPVAAWGRSIRNDPAFRPTGTNVNFVHRVSPTEIRVRTYEKGVEAETLACGTGAVAAAWTTHALYPANKNRITVQMPGGRLYVGWADGDRLYLEGDAKTTFSGVVEISV